MSKTNPNPADYIVPLSLQGLNGRMLHMPAPKNRKRQIMVIYGHHSSLERWFGLAQVLNEYGAVTMPDLPGFGAMDSMYEIGKVPSLDNLADYLADFIKQHYGDTHLTIIGMSVGFVMVTRMLQRYPELTGQVDLLVSLVGFMQKDDFTFSPARYWSYRLGASFLKMPVASKAFLAICLHPAVLRVFYGKTHNAKNKFGDLTPAQRTQMMEIEIWLWRNNDVRTYMYTTQEFLRFDNTHRKVALPVWHVGVKEDHFFNNRFVEQGMKKVFTGLHSMTIDMTKHAPTVIADAKDAAPFIPDDLRRELSKS